MFPPLTKRQKELLDYIKVFRQLNGYSPSLTDIKDHFNLSAISTVHEHIENLKQKGYIRKEINQARSVRAVESRFGTTGIAEIPVMGQIEEYGQVNTENRTHIIVMHESILPSQGDFFALGVNTANLYDKIAKQGDILVFTQQDTAEEGDTVVVEPEPGIILFGTIGFQKDKTRISFATQEKEDQLFNNIQILGKAVSLVRSLS